MPDVSQPPDADTVHDGYKNFFSIVRVSQPPRLLRIELLHATDTDRAFLPLPGFVPWGEVSSRPIAKDQGRYGLVGDAVSHFLVPALMRGMYLTKMRRCMEPRGYTRYPLSRPPGT